MASLGLFKVYFYRKELAGRHSFSDRKKAVRATCAAIESHKHILNAHYGKAE
jgi:hypothetical protein